MNESFAEKLTFNDLHLNQRKYHHMSIPNVIELEISFLKIFVKVHQAKTKKKGGNITSNQFSLIKKSSPDDIIAFVCLSLRLSFGTCNKKWDFLS